MERAFIEPVLKSSGKVKFPAGLLLNWPKNTWLQVAKNMGKDLDDVTISKEQLAKNLIAPESKRNRRQRTRLEV